MTNGLGLGDAYDATIERIKVQGGDKSRLGMESLMWISHAERPLKANELCHALAVELGSTAFNNGNVPSISTLVSCCQGLITVDKEASTVRLVHYTLQEYLSAHPDIFSTPHSSMAEICLTYLNSDHVKAITADSSSSIDDTPFLEYCSVYWGVHSKRQLSDRAKSLALELLQEHDGHISTRLLLRESKELFLGHSSTNFQFSGLHHASFFGISELVAALIEMECCDANEGDFWARTPLSWAARNGHQEVVEILLEQATVNPDKPDWWGQTPLSHAAQMGHEAVVKILVGQEEVNPNEPDCFGRTPLLYAAWNGHEGVTKVLLELQAVNPDKPTSWGQTPLSYAAKYGHEGVVKKLLERQDVNPDQPTLLGRTPISFAAEHGHEAVVETLLGREEVNPNKPDNDGLTPLMHAARSSRTRVIELLKAHEAVASRAT